MDLTLSALTKTGFEPVEIAELAGIFEQDNVSLDKRQQALLVKYEKSLCAIREELKQFLAMAE